MDDWRFNLFLAVRAAQRSLNQSDPAQNLKRQRNTLQRLIDALRLTTELAAKGDATPALRQRILHGANAANAIFDDVHYGPNDLDLPCDDLNSSSSVRATLMAALDVIFWLESCNQVNQDAKLASADAFREHISTALRAGISQDSDSLLAQGYDWSAAAQSNIITGDDGLLCLSLSQA